ncbi:thiamine-phosphate kinase [Psychromonas aquimarina]|uniref:thiamine-phosphate kinase n=1 Tax=Psychromonas aquimarina TaxID=444919 RepID=UPI00040CBCA7|nr:thiamine-phosphate kinase [Psychromonas aquimarina]
MSLSEFDLIDHYFKRGCGTENSGVAIGIGDDCAVLDIPDGYQLAVTTDSLVCDIHFFADVDPYRLGYKSLAVNLSDLAAMGAVPKWISLAITLPENKLPADNAQWLAEFSRGFFELADKHNVQLVGGDTTKGPLSITVSVKGLVPRGLALQRSTAQAGDLICVSSSLGNGALGLACSLDECRPENRQYFIDALELTEPRIELGILLRSLASSCMDISDGLTQDLKHILKSSSCAARLDIDKLPLSELMYQEIQCGSISEHQAEQYALTGGDDYELLFTISTANLEQLNQLIEKSAVKIPAVSVIGSVMQPQLPLIQLFKDNKAVYFSLQGWDHFKGQN